MVRFFKFDSDAAASHLHRHVDLAPDPGKWGADDVGRIRSEFDAALNYFLLKRADMALVLFFASRFTLERIGRIDVHPCALRIDVLKRRVITRPFDVLLKVIPYRRSVDLPSIYRKPLEGFGDPLRVLPRLPHGDEIVWDALARHARILAKLLV